MVSDGTRSGREGKRMPGLARGEALTDDSARYSLEVAPIYQRLRRLVVQLAGIAILAQSGQSAEWPDHPTLGAAREALEEAHDNFSRVRVIDAQQESHMRLQECITDLRWVIRCVQSPASSELRENREPRGVATRLDHAYRALQLAANEQLGFSIIDMRQSCCCPVPHDDGTHRHGI